MRLSFPTRPLSALFALWFAFVLGDPGILHGCPMHGAAHAGMPGGMQAEAGTQGGMHGGTGGGTGGGTSAQHHAASAHAPSGAVSHSGSLAGQEHDAAAPCTCVGQCCATTAVTPVVGVVSFALPALVAAPHRPMGAPADEPPAQVGLRLQYANGPPEA